MHCFAQDDADVFFCGHPFVKLISFLTNGIRLLISAETGKIIMQKAVSILPGDTAEILQKRVMQEAEWEILPMSAELVCAEMIKTRGV